MCAISFYNFNHKPSFLKPLQKPITVNILIWENTKYKELILTIEQPYAIAKSGLPYDEKSLSKFN